MRFSELKRTFEAGKKLYEMYREISDTYNDISQGDYISKLMKSEQELEAQRRASVQERSEPKHEPPTNKPPMQDISQKQEPRDSAPEKSEPKSDEPAQKPTTQHNSRSRRGDRRRCYDLHLYRCAAVALLCPVVGDTDIHKDI